MCINFNKISSNLIKVLGVFPLFFFRSSHRCAGCARVCVCEWNVFFVFSLFEIPFNFWLNNLQIHTYRSWCAFSSIIDTATEQISIHMRMQIATIPPKGPTLPFPVARIPLWACVHYQFMTKEWEKTSFYQKKKKKEKLEGREPHRRSLRQSLDVLLGQQQWTQLDDDASVATVSTESGPHDVQETGSNRHSGIGIRMGCGCGDQDTDNSPAECSWCPDGPGIRTELNRTELNWTELRWAALSRDELKLKLKLLPWLGNFTPNFGYALPFLTFVVSLLPG